MQASNVSHIFTQHEVAIEEETQQDLHERVHILRTQSQLLS
jgi:hypothetical protein